jgi:hypothetical protein
MVNEHFVSALEVGSGSHSRMRTSGESICGHPFVAAMEPTHAQSTRMNGAPGGVFYSAVVGVEFEGELVGGSSGAFCDEHGWGVSRERGGVYGAVGIRGKLERDRIRIT